MKKYYRVFVELIVSKDMWKTKNLYTALDPSTQGGRAMEQGLTLSICPLLQSSLTDP